MTTAVPSLRDRAEALRRRREIALREELSLEETFLAEVGEEIADRYRRSDYSSAYRLRREAEDAEAHIARLREELDRQEVSR